MTGRPIPSILDILQNHLKYNGSGTRCNPIITRVQYSLLEIDPSRELIVQIDVALLLQFVTGSARVPLGGFSMLRGLGALQKFNITRSVIEYPNQLPTASTW